MEDELEGAAGGHVPVGGGTTTFNVPAGGDAVPVSREQLVEWYAVRLLSLQQIADLAGQRLGTSVSRAKVREWLLARGVPRRSFSEAARVKFQRRRAAQAGDTAGAGRTLGPGQLTLFPDRE